MHCIRTCTRTCPLHLISKSQFDITNVLHRFSGSSVWPSFAPFGVPDAPPGSSRPPGLKDPPSSSRIELAPKRHASMAANARAETPNFRRTAGMSWWNCGLGPDPVLAMVASSMECERPENPPMSALSVTRRADGLKSSPHSSFHMRMCGNVRFPVAKVAKNKLWIGLQLW